MIRCVSGLIFQEGRVLLTLRRFDNEASPGLWEAPAGKVEEGEKDGEALRREMFEELGILGKPGEQIGQWMFRPPRVKSEVLVVLFRFYWTNGDPWPKEGQPAMGWFDRDGLSWLASHGKLVPSLTEFHKMNLWDTLQ